MGKKDKLIQKLKLAQNGFSYDEAVNLLCSFGYEVSNKGKTSGSRVVFKNIRTGGLDLKNSMEYKGYVGSVEFSEEDGLLYGKVQGIRALLSYEGKSVEELKEDFHEVIDEYLNDCQEEGIHPEVPYGGKIEIQIAPELHKKVADAASCRQMSIDSYVENIIEEAVHVAG